MIANVPSSTVVPNGSTGAKAGSYLLIGLLVLGVAAYVDYNYTHFFLNKQKDKPKA